MKKRTQPRFFASHTEDRPSNNPELANGSQKKGQHFFTHVNYISELFQEKTFKGVLNGFINGEPMGSRRVCIYSKSLMHPYYGRVNGF